MKILHYINDLRSGGAETLLSKFLPKMKERGHDVHLAMSNQKQIVPEFVDIFNQWDIPIHDFNMSRFDLRNLNRLNTLNQEHQFDVIHTHLFPTQYWLSLAKKLNQQIFVHTEHSKHNGRRAFPVLRKFDQLSYNAFDLVISITAEVENHLHTWIREFSFASKIIHNGVDVLKIKEANVETPGLDYSFLDSQSPSFTILMVGSFRNDASKDHKRVIEALHHLSDDVHVLFAGTGENEEKCKQLVREKGWEERVHFLGLRPDVPYLMNQVDLNLLSSNFEGMSGVTLEAMASQTPFVGSNVVGIKDIVPDETFLFREQSAPAIAQKIQEVRQDKNLYQTMVQKGNEHVKQFELDEMVSNYLKAYQHQLQAKH